MLAVSPLSTTTTTASNGCRDIHSDMDSLPCFSIGADVDFPEFDTIDFDDLFSGDSLPYLEIDPSDLLADFSVCPSTSAGEEDSGVSVDYTANQIVPDCYNGGNCTNSDGESKSEKDEFNKVSSIKEDAIHSKKSSNSPLKPIRQGHKSSKSNNNSNNEGKRKTKVDWTPDLHRRFVQAVEQLGVDKAVPSRILELMGIDCLTRHNVASHLQKYRSHRKHLLAREAEAANWTQKRQIYGMAVAPPPQPPPNGGSNKKNANHVWPGPPTMGFPPPAPPPIHRPFRPLHVWGHPTHHHVEHPTPMPIWPKQLIPPPPHAWAAPLPAHHPSPPVDPSLWHSRHQRVPNAATPLTPCFPHPLPATRFAMAQPVPGIPPTHTAMYKPDQHRIAPPPPAPLQSVVANPDTLDSHPTKESIDAAIEDVLSKPWLPLPIGLKPPATDSVMGELQRQGIPAIPPSCA